jgi:hypothetical protein
LTQTARKAANRIEAMGSQASLYVNYFELGHNPYEFLIDLGQYRPTVTESGGMVTMHTMVAISPPYAKLLSQLLAAAVDEHESEHGKIAEIAATDSPFERALRSFPEFELRARELLNEVNSGADKNLKGPLKSTAGEQS